MFHHLPFPDEERLFELAEAYIQKYNPDDELVALLQPLVNRFKEEYDKMKGKPNIDKVVSTSELLDWLRVISFYKPYKNEELWVNAQGALEFKDGTVLYPEVLFKSRDDFKSQMGK